MRLDFALVIGTIFLVDQCTKLLASTYLNYAEPLNLLPFFSFTLLHNTGAAFSFLADAGGCVCIFTVVVARSRVMSMDASRLRAFDSWRDWKRDRSCGFWLCGGFFALSLGTLVVPGL